MITIDQLKPFYQVIIFEVDDSFDLNDLKLAFRTVIDEKVKKSQHFIEIISIINEDDYIYIAQLLHKFSPSWLSEKNVSKNSIIEKNENIENDLLILYLTENYLFIDSQCSTILSLIELAIEKLVKANGLKAKQLKAKKIQTILNSYNIQYRTLSISNIYNAGGTAPESKAYYSKNARFCLSPSFDTGFGFNYCLGAYQDQYKNFIPFGISSKKSKIWRTWVEDIDDFIDNCDELVEMINKNSNNNNLQLLVSAIEAPDVNSLVVLQFYMDYNIQQKGMVFLVKQSPVLDWYCYINENINNQIIFNVQENSSLDSVKINYEYNEADESFLFSYNNEKQTLGLIIWNETDDIEKKRRVDLVEYLNKQRGYTILMSDGIAYRDNSFWKDNRFTNLYKKAMSSIDWSNVDIRRENKPARISGKINIFDRLKNYSISDLHSILGINDNGSEEISDLIVITNDKFILIHAKYSSDELPGLRVEDIQVVVSQALKNLRYFISDNFSDDKIKRLYKNIYHPNSITFTDFKNLFFSSLNSFEIKKECWIVQPGLSKTELEHNPDNKIHILLNYVESICVSNGIDFSFYGNN
jgi:hypothetical protein